MTVPLRESDLVRALRATVLAPLLAYLPLGLMIGVGGMPGHGRYAVHAWMLSFGLPLLGLSGLVLLKAWRRLALTAALAVPASFVAWFFAAVLVAMFKDHWPGLLPSAVVVLFVYLMTDIHVKRLRRAARHASTANLVNPPFPKT
ncbi:MAG: hypothetical protein ACK46X_11875 [Candidatus Sericytochromatia bacterium]